MIWNWLVQLCSFYTLSTFYSWYFFCFSLTGHQGEASGHHQKWDGLGFGTCASSKPPFMRSTRVCFTHRRVITALINGCAKCLAPSESVGSTRVFWDGWWMGSGREETENKTLWRQGKIFFSPWIGPSFFSYHQAEWVLESTLPITACVFEER